MLRSTDKKTQLHIKVADLIAFMNSSLTKVDKEIRNLQHVYDSLNAHIFHDVDSNLVVKVAKTQLHKGVLDLIFETQLKMTLNDNHSVVEEVYELANDGHHLMNYVCVEKLNNTGGQ